METMTMHLFVDPMRTGGFRAKWVKFGTTRYTSKKCATEAEAAALARAWLAKSPGLVEATTPEAGLILYAVDNVPCPSCGAPSKLNGACSACPYDPNPDPDEDQLVDVCVSCGTQYEIAKGCPCGVKRECPYAPEECSMIRERSVAGTSNEIPACPTHGAFKETP